MKSNRNFWSFYSTIVAHRHAVIFADDEELVPRNLGLGQRASDLAIRRIVLGKVKVAVPALQRLPDRGVRSVMRLVLPLHRAKKHGRITQGPHECVCRHPTGNRGDSPSRYR